MAEHAKSDERTHMKILDLVYYAIYRFTVSIPRQGHLGARACAGACLPYFILVDGMFLYYVLTLALHVKMLPHNKAIPWIVGLYSFGLVLVFIVYERKGRGQRIVAGWERTKSKRLYFWLGAACLLGHLLLPILSVFTIGKWAGSN